MSKISNNMFATQFFLAGKLWVGWSELQKHCI
jgi:hypothetical protein